MYHGLELGARGSFDMFGLEHVELKEGRKKPFDSSFMYWEKDSIHDICGIVIEIVVTPVSGSCPLEP